MGMPTPQRTTFNYRMRGKSAAQRLVPRIGPRFARVRSAGFRSLFGVKLRPVQSAMPALLPKASAMAVRGDTQYSDRVRPYEVRLLRSYGRTRVSALAFARTASVPS